MSPVYKPNPDIRIEATRLLHSVDLRDDQGNVRHFEPGDYMITNGVDGEQYGVKRAIFEKKYVQVPTESH